MVNVKKPGLVLLIAIMFIGTLVGVSNAVASVNPNDVPTMLQGVWNYIVTFFALAPVITVVAFGRNIYGYLVEYFKGEYSEEYDFSKLGETLTMYVGLITTMITAIEPISSVVPEPYSGAVKATIAVCAAAVVVIDILRQQLKNIGI